MAKKKKQKKSNKKKIGVKSFFILLFTVIVAVVFTPTTSIILVGMLPTLVAYLVDNSLEKNKTLTIGAMNFAGCFPYLLSLWKGENTLNAALSYLENPKTIIFIYSIAALGYIINWLVTMGISTILKQRSHMRIERIKSEKKKLKDRWGDKVNGKYELDTAGFPIEMPNEGVEKELKSESKSEPAASS